MTQIAPDLGAYILPGKIVDPREGVTQAIEAERIGLGAVWASERLELKETGAVLGAVSQATRTIRLCTGTTHFVSRHPMVLAGMAATLQGLSNNRLLLSFSRSLDSRWKDLGLPVQSTAVMTDYVDILRRLWAGEKVSYDGPAGRFPKMQMADVPSLAPPLVLAAMGPKTLALAGRVFDGVLLHPFLTVKGIHKSVEIIRQAVIDAGRSLAAVKIYATVVVAPDLSQAERAFTVKGRAASYLIHRMISTWLLKLNGWDAAPVEALEKLGLENIELQALSTAEVQKRLIEASKLLPDEWIESGAAVGSAAECAQRLKEIRKAGADEIVMHGSTPDKLQALVTAYVGS